MFKRKNRVMRMFSVFTAVSVFLISLPSFSAKALTEKELEAPSAVLIDASTGRVLFDKAMHQVRPCASITKVMTLTLVMEAIDQGRLHLNDKVVTSAHAASMGGSDIWLEQGETMTVDEMIKATVVASANDAAVALAETVAGSEDEFVGMMNEKAKKIGMKETVFKNCNGLDEEGHVTSAYDVALMSRELLKHPKILEYSGIWMDELRGGKTQLVNTNKLLKSYKGITGLKTGTTSKAGSCISATAERDGVSLIAVVLGCSTGKARFSDASALLDYGFDGYRMYTPTLPDEMPPELPVKNGMDDSVSLSADVSKQLLVSKSSVSSIVCDIYLPSQLDAPVKKGEVIGKLIYKNGSDRIAEYPVTAAEDIKEVNFGDVAGLMFRSLAG